MFSGDYTFLTTKPRARFMSKAHPEILHVLPHADNNPYTLDARITKFNETTADYQIDSITARAGEVYIFEIGWNEVAYPDKANIRKIEIYMGGNYGTADDILTFYPVTLLSDQVKALYYQNSAGGLDSIFCQGNQSLVQDNAGVAIRSGVSLAKHNSSRVYGSAHNRARFGYQVYTGYSSRQEILALQDLFLIDYAWEWTSIGGEDRFVPIEIDRSVSWPPVRENRQALPIKYRYATEKKAITRIGL